MDSVFEQLYALGPDSTSDEWETLRTTVSALPSDADFQATNQGYSALALALTRFAPMSVVHQLLASGVEASEHALKTAIEFNYPEAAITLAHMGAPVSHETVDFAREREYHGIAAAISIELEKRADKERIVALEKLVATLAQTVDDLTQTVAELEEGPVPAQSAPCTCESEMRELRHRLETLEAALTSAPAPTAPTASAVVRRPSVPTHEPAPVPATTCPVALARGDEAAEKASSYLDAVESAKRRLSGKEAERYVPVDQGAAAVRPMEFIVTPGPQTPAARRASMIKAQTPAPAGPVVEFSKPPPVVYDETLVEVVVTKSGKKAAWPPIK